MAKKPFGLNLKNFIILMIVVAGPPGIVLHESIHVVQGYLAPGVSPQKVVFMTQNENILRMGAAAVTVFVPEMGATKEQINDFNSSMLMNEIIAYALAQGLFGFSFAYWLMKKQKEEEKYGNEGI